MLAIRTARRAAGALVVAALFAISIAQVAAADAPSGVPALTAQPASVAPGGEILVRGTGCVGTGGQPGVASVSVVGSDGSSSQSSTSSVDANGSWALSVKAQSAGGTMAINATCDIYGQAIAYPSTSVAVVPGGETAPPVSTAPRPQPTATTSSSAPQPEPGTSSASRTSQSAADPTDSESSAPHQPVSKEDLPSSGVDVVGPGVLAVILIGAGAASLLLGRRRR